VKKIAVGDMQMGSCGAQFLSKVADLQLRKFLHGNKGPNTAK
jgi:hypothetical protein